MENIITEKKRGRGRPKGSKNKKSASVIKTTAPSTQPVAQPIIADEYNDVIYMPMDSVLEKFGDMQYIAVSASWVKDNLISSFIKETKSLKKNPKDVAEKELNTPTKVLDNEEDNAKVEFNLTEF